jgi:hypothetical protein
MEAHRDASRTGRETGDARRTTDTIGTMTSYLLIVALIAGLLMFLLSANAKVVRIGELLLFSSILALLVAVAPATVKLLHG